MSTAPSTPPMSLCLSEPERKALERFAADQNLTIEEAATRAAQLQLQARFVTAKRFINNVARFPR